MTQSELKVRQGFAWLVLATFVCGLFWSPVGAWTGPILGLWFVGTQRLRAGFLWIFAIAFVPAAAHHWRLLGARDGLGAVLLLAAAAISVLPFLLHRSASTRLNGIAWTLPFPLANLLLAWAIPALLLPLNAGSFRSSLAVFEPMDALNTVSALRVFGMAWFAAIVVCLWDREFRLSGLLWPFAARPFPWNQRKETIALLRSPATGAPVRLAGHGNSLHSTRGETFPIRDGMPVFLRPQDLTGMNRKYNRLYETIGGFYDDSQRVACALGGMDRDAYVMSYMGSLEVKPGDTVLETSVGTGLNFKYLPRDIRRFGLDLSREMLLRCQDNLRRWEMQADLFVGNAEALPFADESFDVVFHVGGINFFSDRAAAIREMIRVAKPGSLLLIADETEEHVKAAYESIPYTREFFKGREDAVSVPLDLVPAEMENVGAKILEIAGKKRFYALTFRKPRVPAREPAVAPGAEAARPTMKA
ncbi:MAG: class I SAM-dependent methyltransferase [Terracidiphilus sp.]